MHVLTKVVLLIKHWKSKWSDICQRFWCQHYKIVILDKLLLVGTTNNNLWLLIVPTNSKVWSTFLIVLRMQLKGNNY